MKKIIFLLVASILALAILPACGKKNKNTIRLNEVTHSVFYAPLYLAIEDGYFEEYGYKIKLTNGGGADKSMTALISGSADIALMGPESAIYTYLGGKKDYPKVFGQLTKKDGSFLVSRKAEPNFKWSDLQGKEIIAGRKGGVPAMTLEYVLKNNGLVDGQNVTLNYDVQFSMTASAFINGVGDYVTVFEPTASEMQKNGQGYIVASVGQGSGEVPYTSFITTQSYLKNNGDMVENFLKAIKKAYDFIYTHTEIEVAQKIVKQFPSTTVETLAVSIKSYKDIDAWVNDLIMSEQSFERLQDIMQGAGELEKRVDYDKLVDNTFALKLK